MRARGRLTVALPACLLLVSGAIAFTRAVGVDYGNPDCDRVIYCDDAAPSLSALTHGDVSRFFHEQRLIGPVSLLMRAPIVALARLHSYDLKLIYDLGSFACLLALAGAGALVAIEMRRRRRPAWQQWVIALGILVNPVTFRALHFGHPEELLGAALSVAAALAAIARRPVATGVLLGLAVATKLWALLAVPALVLALPPALRVRAAIAVAVTTVALYGPMAAGDPGRFRHALVSANKIGAVAGTGAPTNAWWFLMRRGPFRHVVGVRDGRPVYQTGIGLKLPGGIGGVTHSVVVLVAVALAWLWSRRRPPPGDPAVLLLLALILLLRCILDPGNFSYYHLPFLACLIAYEGLTRRGLPFVGIAAAAALQISVWLLPHVHSDAGFVWIYLGWALPVAGLLAFLLFRPRLRGQMSPSANAP